jgi:hypothetical protein
VQSYVIEMAVNDATELAEAGERARVATEQLSLECNSLRLVRSVYLPEHQTGQLVFEAPTPQAVHAASRRAGITYERIFEC